ncbi:MAG: PaaI family thioesterase [Erysipelothrix sp.]|nr:PaaI family thioesterase [Erysipelothrix sp.]
MELMDVLNQKSIISDNLNLRFVSAQNGESEIRMSIDEKVLNPYQIVHGGAIFTLADSAAGAAAISFNDAYVTMDSFISFMNPGVGSELIAKAKTNYKGDDTCVIEVEVKNDMDLLIAKGMFTMFKIDVSAF